MLSYYQPAVGRNWSVVLGLPAYRAQQIALTIAGPLLIMISLLFIIAVILMRLGINSVTASLQNLATEASRIAQGQLDTPLKVEGVDEVGRLRRAFEKMRISLKARLDELNRLLIVSQGVASSLEVSDAVQPVLEAALATGASAARIVLPPAIVPNIEGDSSQPVCFGLGPSQDQYQELDKQLLAFTRQQERLVLPSLLRPRLLTFTPGAPRPESLLAVALHHEDLYYGTLWIAFDQPHTFSEEEVRFLVTLGGQAALAVTNARLFMNAETGRQRLSSIISSTPDPVLVIDQRGRLLLANPAAWQVLGLGVDIDEGVPIEQIIEHTELLNLLRSNREDERSVEVTFPDGSIYLAAATQVQTEGQKVGRVCVLRDITHFKELDALKSEFVSTVSHDLRSPLTLMRGYATMLEMVGQINEQQRNYVRKIITGVESMSRLVNNLLDLGRIEAGIGLQLEKVPVQDVVERVVGALQLQAAQRNIQLTANVPASIPLIEADQALLQQALQNLVENAVKYTRPEGKVHVDVKNQPIGVVFSIKDTGIGISPMDQPRLFERFFRGAQHASREERGTGLGLTIVKSIADRHGGKVWADSQLGKGSIFYLAIPITQPRPENEPQNVEKV
jgi:PAS domain S-box-containing protein